MKRRLIFLIVWWLGVSQLLAQRPTFASFTPTSGPIGTEVTITGTNFDATLENNNVFFGGVKANVLSATEEELRVEVPPGATYHSIVVLVDKFTVQSSQPFTVTFESDGSLTASNSFEDGLNFTPGDYPVAAIQADFDGDGLLDLASVNEDGLSYSVFRNMSTGTGDISFGSDLGGGIGGVIPKDIAYADINGDGKLDIVLGVSGGFGIINNIGVLKNTSSVGSISFASVVSFNADSNPMSIAVGDLNRDGKADLVAVDGDDSQVSIFKNTTNLNADVIRFDTHLDFDVGASPVSVAIADVDGDGLLDIITANSDDASVSILRNTSTTGAWSFDSKVDISVDSSTPAFKVLAGDIDGDGLADILTKNEQQLTILRNTSTEANVSFSTAQNITFNTGFGFPGFGDLNGDSKLDVIVPGNGNDLEILTNTSTSGTISFSSAVSLNYGADLDFAPFHVSTADMDLDGEPEIIVPGEVGGFSGSSTPELQVIRNLSSGTTFSDFSLPGQTSSTTIDDVNHTIYLTVDGVDITSIVATFTISSGAASDIGGVDQESATTINDFTNPVTYTISAEDGTTQDWVVTATVGCPGDVINETVVTCESYDFDGEVIISSGTYTRDYINRFGCDSTVTVDLTIHPLEFYENVYTIGSYDFDGTTLTTSGQYEYGPFTSTETGCDSTFYLNLTIEPDTYDPQNYVQFQMEDSAFPIIETLGVSHVEDVNGDGEKDVFFIGNTTDGGGASLFINDGDGTFTEKIDHGIVGARVANRSSMFLDANGDDVLDFLVIGRTSGTNFTKLYLNDGVGNFTEKTDHGLPDLGLYSITSYLDSADVDGDDDLDLVITIFGVSDADSNQPELWLNNGDGSFQLSTANVFPSSEFSLANFSDFDGDGDADLLLRGLELKNKLWLNDGAGVFTEKLDQSLTSLSSFGMVIFDADGDGDLDIYDSNTEAYSALYTAMYFNNGDGSFTYDLSSDMPRLDGNVGEAGTLSRAVDIDNDGDLDLIMEGRYGFTGGPPIADYFDVWINNGFGHFRPLGSRTLGQVYPSDPFEFGRTLGYSNYQINRTLSVHDFDGDGRTDILLSGIDYVETFDRVTKLFYNKEFSSELVVEACNSYEFDGTTLTSSGNYQGAFTDEYGTSFPVNLDLTINNCYHWSGTTSSDWFTDTNWEEGTVPSITDNVFINSSANDPVIVGDASVNDLTIASGAILTIESGSALNIQGVVDGDGYAIVKRNTTGDKGYSIIGSMVADAVVEDIEADYIYTFDGDDYQAPSNSEIMEAGKGYFVAFNESSPSVNFYGTLNSGDQSYALLSSDKFHLVANPYAAPVNHNALISGNTSFDGTIYLWDDGGSNFAGVRDGAYVTVNAAGVATGTGGLQGKDAFNGNIGSGQGFFIYADDATSIDFTPAMQSTTAGDNADGAFYRMTALQYIRLILSNADFKDDLVVMLHEGATEGFDAGLDARKLRNPNLSFFSLQEEKELAIQAVSKNAEEVILPLTYDVLEPGEFTIQIEEAQDLSGDLEILLHDIQTGEVYDLRDHLSVALALKPQDEQLPSFNLVIRRQILSQEEFAERTMVYVNEGFLKVKSRQLIKSFVLYDLKGRVAYSNLGLNTLGYRTIKPYDPGVYIVHLGLENGVETHKIVVK